MTATHTQDIDATVALVNLLAAAGADVVRIAVDNKKDAEALAEIRRQTEANLSVDLQENYRLVELVAPHVDKVRYNPGHLYHHEREKPWQEKVRLIADIAAANDCALRVGVNCGSVDPAKRSNTTRRIRSRQCSKVPGSTASCSIRSALRGTACR
jgi:(E)-4-hydroxy-3-methylbut-2-enyl-diphosphate synthase